MRAQSSALTLPASPETTHVIPQKNVLREDTPRQSFSRDELLKSAPQKRDGYIFVPQVVE